MRREGERLRFLSGWLTAGARLEREEEFYLVAIQKLMKDAAMKFDSLLERFSVAIEAGDTKGLAALFTPDGCYDDGFFGPHAGREAIAAMIGRWYVGGEKFRWQFLEPLNSETLGYARYCFSYNSREPESIGELIVVEGTARFQLRDELIAHYCETGDRGMTFVQLGYGDSRICKLLNRFANRLKESNLAKQHLKLRAG